MTTVQRAAIVVTIALVVASMVSVVRAESLQEAWAITLSVNPQLQAQNLETAAAERNVAAAKQARVPTVRSFNLNNNLSTTPKIRVPNLGSAAGAGAGAGSGAGAAALANTVIPVIGRDQTDLPISLTFASVPIYTGGRITNNIRAARSQQNYQQSEVFRTVLDLKITVAEAYISLDSHGENTG
jgi:outer membrane protein